MISIYGYERKTINRLSIGDLLETLKVEVTKCRNPTLREV
jgi:hypothetical protein